MSDIAPFADAINHAISAHPALSKFPTLRRKLRGRSKVASWRMFDPRTTKGYYAYHYGGRDELQFNIGFEEKNDEWFRYGVAFSLEPSRTLPDPVTALRRKIDRFNQFIAHNSGGLEDLSLRSYVPSRNPRNSAISALVPIPAHLVAPGNFLFAGHFVRTAEYDPQIVAELLGRLLPLYEYVEGPSRTVPTVSPAPRGFRFRPGCTTKPSSTSAHRSGGKGQVTLRHNQLQEALFAILERQHGKDKVGAESGCGVRSRIDIAVLDGKTTDYYEIKVGLCVRSCFREAISQLMEYSYWPDGTRADRLVIVSENELTKDAARYLKCLRNEFRLPLYYRQLDLEAGRLGPFQ